MIKKDQPFFIVFEGIDGSGKTTLSKMLFAYLKKNNFDVIWLMEPSASKWGEKIRNIAQSSETIPIEEELNYFIEDRKWDVKQNINPALKQNRVVILDRYYFSTACYQGARGFDIQKILKLNQAFAPEPDLTFIIDVEVKTGLGRIAKNRKSKVKLFEKEPFLEKVRKNYLSLHGPKLRFIDGNQDLETAFSQIKKILNI